MENCITKRGEQDCLYCRRVCPANAISESGFELEHCSSQCLLNGRHHDDTEKKSVCGKCATGPCAMRIPN